MPFAELWRRVLSETQSTALWKKLRRIVSLVLQLILLLLILTAILDPRLSATQHGRSIAIVVDTSASMQATDGGGGATRLAAAKAEARRLVARPRRRRRSDDRIAWTRGRRRAAASRATIAALLGDIDALMATDTPADLLRALRLAGDALRGRQRPTLVLVGDGAWPRADLADGAHALGAAVDLRYLPIGKSSDNVGVTAFAVRRYQANQTAYEVLVEVQSFRARRSTVTLQLVQDGEVVEAQKLTLGAGERVQRLYPDLAGAGTRLEARLVDAHDALGRDDVAYAVLPKRRKQKVLLVTAGDLFLEGALLLDENLDVDKLPPARWDAASSARYDAVVLDGFTPATPPRTNALYLDPHGAASPFAVRGGVDAPVVTETAATHPLMRWVALKDLNIAARLHLRPASGRRRRGLLVPATDPGGPRSRRAQDGGARLRAQALGSAAARRLPGAVDQRARLVRRRRQRAGRLLRDRAAVARAGAVRRHRAVGARARRDAHAGAGPRRARQLHRDRTPASTSSSPPARPIAWWRSTWRTPRSRTSRPGRRSPSTAGR